MALSHVVTSAATIRTVSRCLSRIGPSLSVDGKRDIEPADGDQAFVEDLHAEIADLVEFVLLAVRDFQHERVVDL